MADTPEFSWESIMESLKKMFSDSLPGFLKGLPGKLMSSLTDNPIISFLTKLFHLEGAIDSAKDKIEQTTNDLVAKAAPDLATATSGSITAANNFFETSKSALGMDDKVSAAVKTSTTKLINDFYANGTPELSKDAQPVAAYKAVTGFAETLYENLTNEETGLLPITMDNREQLGKRIVSMVTGIRLDDDNKAPKIQALVKTPPTSGLSAMLASVQTKLNDKNLTPSSLKESDITMRIDASIVAPAGADEIKNNTPNYQTADVKQPATPTLPKQATAKINIWAPK